MDDHLITQITVELRAKLVGRFLGRIFQLSPLSFAVDFGIKGGEYLLISAEPSSPRLYLIKRRLKELEKASIPPGPFAQILRAKLSGARTVEIEKVPDDRIVRFMFQSEDETGRRQLWTIVVQLTGRAANLLLLDERARIVDALRAQKSPRTGEIYQAPLPRQDRRQTEPRSTETESPSAVADAYFQQLDAEKVFDTRAKRLRARLHQKLKQKQKLRTNLQNDLQSHGDAEGHKRLGDLLLANLGTAVRRGRMVEINDYYTEGAPTISIEIEESATLQEEATRKFRQYTKAKRAREEIVERLAILQTEIAILEKDDEELQKIINTRDAAALSDLDQESAPQSRVHKRAEPARIPGVRHYVSSDGYEILVGRGARDNDNLTFRIARPNDLWLHAADYPGSHVVVRNPTRKEIPQKTMLEAAQLAGKFSQAGDDAKVVVHYTQRKFLGKPKGAAPGLVRMANFRSITIEPKEGVSRVR